MPALRARIRISLANHVRPWLELSSIAPTASKRSGETWVGDGRFGTRWSATRLPCSGEKSVNDWKASVGGLFPMTKASVVRIWPGTGSRARLFGPEAPRRLGRGPGGHDCASGDDHLHAVADRHLELDDLCPGKHEEEAARGVGGGR